MFKGKYHYKSRKFLSGTIKNEVLTINYERPYHEDCFERKFQANISPYNKRLKKNDKVQGEIP